MLFGGLLRSFPQSAAAHSFESDHVLVRSLSERRDLPTSLKRHRNARFRTVSGRVAWSSPKRWSCPAASWSEQVDTIAWPAVGCFVLSGCLVGCLFCQIRPQLPRLLSRTNIVAGGRLKCFEFASASLSLVDIVIISRWCHRTWWSEHGKRRDKKQFVPRDPPFLLSSLSSIIRSFTTSITRQIF